MSIVSRYHFCNLEIWVDLGPDGAAERPAFLNVFRQPITTCLRCGNLLAIEDLVETYGASSLVGSLESQPAGVRQHAQSR